MFGQSHWDVVFCTALHAGPGHGMQLALLILLLLLQWWLCVW
jgi:hypothetical protein